MKTAKILDVQTQIDAERLLSLYNVNYHFTRITEGKIKYIAKSGQNCYRRAIYYMKRKELTF